jgi:CheY-specific phosphatase CheX
MNSAPSRPDLDMIGGQALVEVLDVFLGLTATRVQPADSFRINTSERPFVAAVKLTGQHVSGVVQIGISHGFAAYALARLIGHEHPHPTTDPGREDFAGELCNLVAGQIAARLRREGLFCELSTPLIADGSLSDDPSSTDRCRTDWSCQGHRLNLEIHLQGRPA